jgi:hypothetical protein
MNTGTYICDSVTGQVSQPVTGVTGVTGVVTL